MAERIKCRKVYKFPMEPTPLEADQLERTASVARFIYNWGLERSKAYYREHGKSKPTWRPVRASKTGITCPM